VGADEEALAHFGVLLRFRNLLHFLLFLLWRPISDGEPSWVLPRVSNGGRILFFARFLWWFVGGFHSHSRGHRDGATGIRDANTLLAHGWPNAKQIGAIPEGMVPIVLISEERCVAVFVRRE